MTDQEKLQLKYERLLMCINRCKNKFAVQPIHWEINKAKEDLEKIDSGEVPEDLK